VKGGGTIAYPNKGVISSKGRKIEGVGITPDKVVPVTLSDLRNQRDAALEEAERTLQSLAPALDRKN
jgi:C-terminal processing protease CtpA/Prc